MTTNVNPATPGDAPPVSLNDWTGYYTISLVVLEIATQAAAAALPKGLRLNPSYGAGGKYPILLSVGSVEDARPRVGGSLGFNYYEIFTAIPGVEVDNVLSEAVVPYLYPYGGYLNRLLPVALGRLSGFRKHWERVTLQQYPNNPEISPNRETFDVKSLVLGKPILDGSVTIQQDLGLSAPNCRVRKMAQLLPPNIIGVDPSGKLRYSIFSFFFDRGVAWNIDQATINIRIADVIPGVNQPVTIEYPPQESTMVWHQDDRYLPVRAFVPWRLQSGGVMKTAGGAQAVGAGAECAAPPPAVSKPGA